MLFRANLRSALKNILNVLTEETKRSLIQVCLESLNSCKECFFSQEHSTPTQTNLPPAADQEELDFLFDEEMEQLAAPRKNTFTDWSDEDSDGELDDSDVNKILIVTQTPPYLRKHPGGDRTGNHISRAKITTELAKAINDGLYYYEQDLWTGNENQLDGTNIKVSRGKNFNTNQFQVWHNIKKSSHLLPVHFKCKRKRKCRILYNL